MLIGSENMNPGKKHPIPRSIGSAKLLLCLLSPDDANPRHRIPVHIPGSAIEHMRSVPTTFGQKPIWGFPEVFKYFERVSQWQYASECNDCSQYSSDDAFSPQSLQV